MGYYLPIRFVAGMTALHLAVQDQKMGVVAVLLERGTDVNARMIDQRRPLDLATSRELRDVLRAAGAIRGLEEA
jgi:ankyrin repeat protein